MENITIQGLSAGLPVDVIDSIVITTETNTSNVLAEWIAYDPSITVYDSLTSAYAVKLFINWSDKNGTINLQQGDYSTFVVPSVFNHDYISNVTDVAITTTLGEVVATYSIYINGDNMKEVRITFTDYVETHTDISGNLWLLLFVGKVTSSEQKTIEFKVNGDLVASGEITVDPSTSNRDPRDEKSGLSVVGDIYNGYYIFSWTIRLNMEEDTVNGFKKIENFTFEDVIPEDSPHVFLTEEIRQQLGLSSNQFPLRIGEYTGADECLPQDRYAFFYYQYNSSGNSYWTNFNNYTALVDGYKTVGIDGDDGLNVSNLVFTEKSFSANLGTLTRPTSLQYCTIATIKIVESALGDEEVVKLFKNTFKASYGYEVTESLSIHRFASGGTAQGITGDYSFMFTKVNEKGVILPGALFALYTSENFTLGADRFVYSDMNGIVTFDKLPVGTYYIQEASTPSEYILDDTIYKVELTSTGFEIYYGNNYEKNLRDQGNKVVNKSAFEYLPVLVELTATKNLIGRALTSGMFNFVVKDDGGLITATGTNYANGTVNFTEIEFDLPGIYTFTVEEVRGGYSGITYDLTKYTIIVTISDAGDGTLTAEISYPNEGVIFNNSYSETPTKPCRCPNSVTKCRKSIEGKKIWIDNDNADDKRPSSIEIILFRDEEVYKSIILDTDGDGSFSFCCLPIRKNSEHEYNYQIDEKNTPDGYTKTIEGYNIINTLIFPT